MKVGDSQYHSCSEEQGGGRLRSTGGCVGMKEGTEGRRCEVMKSLEGEKENLVTDAAFDE